LYSILICLILKERYGLVATNVGNMPELMRNNETVFLIKKGEHDELINTMSFILLI